MDRTSEATIDWISATHHWNTEALQAYRKGYALDALATHITGIVGGWISEKPINGYPHVVSSTDCPGLRVMASEPNSTMGVHVSWSGRALAQHHPRAVLRTILLRGGQVTRIDIAVDHFYWALPEMFYQPLVDGEAVTQAKSYKKISSNTGWTVYVGSRKSEKYLRIYDKAAETGTAGGWTRVELECKGDYARGIAAHVDAQGYQYFPDIIKGFCDFPTAHWWSTLMTSPTLLEGIPKPEKTRDTVKWLMENVAPSVARLLVENHGAYVAFIDRVVTLSGVGESAGEADIFDGKADW